jgi:C_GCAxxG_C_C family probable redox protein
MDEREAVKLARRYFLDERNVYGCAETTFIVLKQAFGLDDPTDSSPAMALNGGIAYSGGACGAISGTALAVGMLAERRVDDHRTAKRIARRIVLRLMDEFRAEHGAIDCRELIPFDLRAPGGHDAFIASGIWRERCMDQIEFALHRSVALADRAHWDRVVAELETAP